MSVNYCVSIMIQYVVYNIYVYKYRYRTLHAHTGMITDMSRS